LTFETLGLAPELGRAISVAGFTIPTDIQQQAIPLALAGQDVMASAQTGTGKTVAFVLPTLQKLITQPARPGRGPRALVLTPTRELAAQVNQSIAQLGKFTRCVTGTLVGGVPYPPQNRMLSKPLDLLVATPGRLLDHLQRGTVNLGRLDTLILDEADRMLDMGFIDDVEKVVRLAPADCQRLLFSATLEGEILKIASRLLKDPVRVQLGGNKLRHELIEQRLHLADGDTHKQALLLRLLEDTAVYQAIVFVATKRGAEELAAKLSADGIQAAALHGDLRQNVRNRIVESLKRGRLRTLVATDVAARGLDAREISHVINFDLPNQAEDYIHRIGRTGRAGATGIAISLVARSDNFKLSRIERLIGRRLDREVLEGLEPRFKEGSKPQSPSNHRGKPQHARGTNDTRKPHWSRKKTGTARPRTAQQSSRA
jgi:superfamily II DNA/RNA helicase